MYDNNNDVCSRADRQECEHDWIANKAYPLSDNAPEVCSKCWIGRHEISVHCPSCGHPFGATSEPAPFDRHGMAVSDAEIESMVDDYARNTFSEDGELVDAVFTRDGILRFARAILSRASSSRAEVESHPDTVRLNWLMKNVNCDEIEGIELPFGGTLEQHFDRFRAAIDAQLAAAEAPNAGETK